MSFAKSLFVLLASVATPLAALAQQSQVGISRLATYQDSKDAGNPYFALSLLPETRDYPLADNHQVVIVVDTSATQTGPVRIESLEVLEELAQSLPLNATAALLACDVDTVDLSGGLVSTTDARWETAVARLKKRIPLGTTNLGLALRSANKLFSDTAAQRTIIYIGDGVNRANFLTKTQHLQLVDELVKAKATVSSLAIGPAVDLASLAAIANQTGGIIVSRGETQESTQSIGRHLAQSISAPVIWVNEAQVPEAMSSYFPQRFPPLRTDRDTVVIGQASAELADGTVTLKGTAGNQTVTLAWKVAAESPNPDMGFLAAVVNEARRDGGVSMPALGSAGLRAMSFMYADNATAIVKAGQFALQSGEFETAIRIAEEALKQDPNNAEAEILLNAAKTAAEKSGQPSTVPAGKFMQFGGDDPNPFGTPGGDDPFADPASPSTPAAGADNPFAEPAPAVTQPAAPSAPAASTPAASAPAPAAALVPQAPAPATASAGLDFDATTPSLLGETLGSGDMLAEELGRRQARAQAIETEVRQKIRDANELLRLSPSSAPAVVSDLKLLLERVDNFADTEPALRSQLRSQVSSALQIAAAAEAQQMERIQRSEAIRAQADQAQRLLAETNRKDEALKQLVEQFNFLMTEHRYLEASKDVAPEITRLAPGSVLDNVTREESSFAANAALIREAYERREQGFVDVMRAVEEAAIPFEGDPPVVYPAPEVWQALTARRKERYSATSLGADGESERRINAALKQEVTDIAYNALPLQQVIAGLADDMKIPIKLNITEIELGGLADADTPITLNIPPVSLRSVLRLILDEHELTYIIKNEVLEITTKDNANEAPINRVYPVGDLVVPIMSGGGMMGGMMGGMGGGMMGGMGGGMGGMGGGMGGMGGGMMGGMGGGMGGMGGGMGGMFVVPDDTSKAAPSKPMPLSHASSSVDVESWVAQLENANEQERQALDEQIRQLVQDKVGLAEAYLEAKDLAGAKAEFEKVIGLVGGLLGAGYPQPWMYQALSLGMEACDYPGAEIKRVLLSSLDFNGDSNQAFKVAEYLARKGMKKEALELLKDLATIESNRYDIFALALPLAEETQDVDAMRWVCTGVLSKVWPQEHAALFERAKLAARATQLRLKQTGRPIEATIFEKEINASMLRDLVVRVNWTGEADLDIRVKEPAGSVCSLTNPQTISGGVLLGDTSSSNSKSTVDGYSEIYACAQGYAGQYDVLIRRVWGNVSGGKATVEVYTDFGTPDQTYVVQQVDLGEKDALVQVEVKHGHRQEPLVEAQLALVRSKQTEVGREVLGQVSSLSSSDAADYASYRRLLAVAGNNAGPGFGFPIGRGAVGYRPVVTVIPEMASIFPTAVISADRRYVRITPNPVFTQIGEVLTYNSSTGAQGQNQGGSGTQGGFTGGGVGGAGGAGGVGGTF